MMISIFIDVNDKYLDIRPKNILLTERGEVKLSGFGLRRHYPRKYSTLHGFNFSKQLFYRAPEVFYDIKNFSKASDVWSLGCVLFEVAHPYNY
jgi:serine/threonine protein kinase